MDEETGLLAFGALVAAILFIAWRANLDAGDVSGGDASAGADFGDVMTGTLQNLGLVNSNDDQDTLARTIWGEARGAGYECQQAVGCVVRNRVKAGGIFASYSGECLKPKQFSCWNSDDVNLPKLMAVDNSDPMFEQCLAIAAGVINGSIPDNTGGAVNYYSTPIVKVPSWANTMVPTVIIRNLHFFRGA